MDNTEKYKYRSAVILTPSDGEKLQKILLDFNCENASQLVKKIVKGKIAIISTEELNALKQSVNKNDVDQYIQNQINANLIKEFVDLLNKYNYLIPERKKEKNQKKE